MADVKQIGQYPQKTTPAPSDAFLLQVGGVGGPYNWMSPEDLVSGALINSSKYLRLAPNSGIAFNGASFTYSGSWFVLSESLKTKALAAEGLVSASDMTVAGDRVATQVYVSDAVARFKSELADAVNLLNTSIITHFSQVSDAHGSLGSEITALQQSVQHYVTESLGSLQQWVTAQVSDVADAVTSWNGRTGDVELTAHDIAFAGGALADSPVFTGRPRAPTPWDVRQADDVIATTGFVNAVVCQFMNDLLNNQPFVFTFNGRQGNVVLRTKDVTDAYFFVDGDVPQAPNPAPFDSSNRIPTTSWVGDEIATQINFVLEKLDFDLQALLDYLATIYAPINSPAFVGTPTAPTAPDGTATDQIATTQFVMNQVAASTTGVASWNGRTGLVVMNTQDIIDAGGAPIDSPIFTGNPTAPTPLAGDSDTSIATTAFVANAVSSAIAAQPPHVLSWNGRTGNVFLQLADLTNVGAFNNTILTGVPIAPTPPPSDNSQRLATTAFVHQVTTAIMLASVRSFNGRTGDVTLDLHDITQVGGAPINSPHFTGVPTAPTAPPGTNTTQLATTAFVHTALGPYAPLDSPIFTGNPQAPTPTQGDNDTSIATTAWVNQAINQFSQNIVLSFNSRIGAVVLNLADITGAGGAPIQDPIFLGDPRAPTPAPGDSDTSIATTAFVTNVADGLQPGLILGDTPPATANDGDIFFNTTTGDMFVWNNSQWVLVGGGAGMAGVSSFNTRTGDVTLTLADVTAAGGAPIQDPTFTGTVQAPTATVGTNTTQVATTAYVLAAIAAATAGVASWNGRTGVVVMTAPDITQAGGALLSSPVFTGDPQAPTPAPGDNDASIATTAFVVQAINNGIAAGTVTSWNGRTGAVTMNSVDITNAGGALLASPNFTGDPRAPTPPIGDSDTTVATTAFVHSVVAQATSGLVSSFNGRTGNVSLTSTDITGAGGALISSPVFTGNPQGPTPAPGDNDTSLATTAFVAAAIAAIPPPVAVTSFNTRTGAVTLTLADVTGVGGAPLASPTFTGIPAAPTAAPGTSTTQLASTAFVMAAIAAMTAGVSSFNGRSGNVTLNLTDIVNAGGAPAASPVLTGDPRAPTPAPGDNDTSIATTAYVMAAIGGANIPAVSVSITQIGSQTWTNVQQALAGIFSIASTALQSVNVDGNSITGLGNSTTPISVTAPSDKVYGRMNGNWVAVQPLLITSATPPANPSPGRLWWDSNGGQLFVWFDDGNSAQWVVANAQGSGAAASGLGDAPADSTLYARRNGVWTPVQITVPVSFILAGKPAAGQAIYIPMTTNLSIASGLSGSLGFGRIPAVVSSQFILNKIAVGGVTTQLGTITAVAGQSSGWTLSGTGGTVAPGEVLQITAPSTQDANLTDVGITILATRA